MKKPLASDFVVDVMDTHVNVVFTPNGNPYMFGRLVDPDDIAHYGPVSRTMGTGVWEKEEYAEDEVAAMAHALAIQAVSTAESE